jgi:hypothetical protein
VPPTKYSCGSNYSCVANPSGAFGSLAECQDACVAPTIPYPDYVVDSLNVSGTLVVGNMLSFSGRVLNQGDIQASVTSHTRLRLDVGNNGGWNVTPTYQATPALWMGGSSIAAWPALWVATAGTHKFEICADALNTFPPNTYGFRGEIAELREQNNCENMVFTVVVPPPDFTILLSPPPPGSQTVEQGGSATYTVTVSSVNSFEGTVNLSPNNLTGSGITQTFPPNPDVVDVPKDGSVTTTLTVGTATTTPRDSYTITVTGTSGTLSHSAPATLQVTAPIPDPWIKTEGGSVGAASGGINMGAAPPGTNVNADYLAIANGAITNFRSLKTWLVGTPLNPYAINSTTIPSYSQLHDKYKPSHDWPAGSSTLPSSGVHEYQGTDFIITPAPTATDLGSGSLPTVLFIPGTLSLNTNVGITRPIIFIVGGNITVDPSVTTANGFYIATATDPNTGLPVNGQFSTSGSNPLTVNGGVIANSLILNRNLPGNQNLIDPSEKFVYNPSYFWYFRNILGTEHTTFKEVAP